MKVKRTKKTLRIDQILTHSQKVEYYDYLNSIEWKSKCTKIMQNRGKQCEVCGCKQRIQVHHKTYKRIFNELPEDLQILCWACHEREHGLR